MNALTTGGLNLPDHIRQHFSVEANDDLTGGLYGGYPVMSYKGKVWALVANGQKGILKNADGDPRASIQVIMVKSNKNMSKTYYAEGYTEGSDQPPTCASMDGERPNDDVVDKQADVCATCPRNAWGSKIGDDGRKGRECSDVRRMAIVDPDNIEEPALLRIPAGSFKNLAEFGAKLKKAGAPYQAMVVKISFDPEAAYPLMRFDALRWLTEAEVPAVAALEQSDVVARIMGQEQTRAAPQLESLGIGAAPAHVQTAASAEAAKAQAGVADKPARGRPKKVDSVARDEVASVLQEAGVPLAAAETPAAPASAPAPQPGPAQGQVSADAAVANADSELASILGGLFAGPADDA